MRFKYRQAQNDVAFGFGNPINRLQSSALVSWSERLAMKLQLQGVVQSLLT